MPPLSLKSGSVPVAKNLDKAGYRVTTLHGGKSQEQREISLEGFMTNVLGATDVAGRGIDIPNVAHFINFDMHGVLTRSASSGRVIVLLYQRNKSFNLGKQLGVSKAFVKFSHL